LSASILAPGSRLARYALGRDDKRAVVIPELRVSAISGTQGDIDNPTCYRVVLHHREAC
jgi:hypothetical protein